MDAPIYAPAAAFVPLGAVPAPRSVASLSLAELMDSPTAWAIVVKHVPAMKMIVGSKQIQPFMTNMMVESFIVYGGVTPEQVVAIDAELQQLPVSEWPVS